MRKIKVIVDSCSSLTKELAEKLDVYVIPTSFSINNHDYKTTDEDLLTYDEFYELLEKKEHSKTTCVNPSEFIDTFKMFLNEGYDIAYISLSSGLSSTHNNALLAKQILSDDYDNQIEIFDSLTGSIGIYHMMYEIIKQIDEGKSLTEIHQNVNKNKIDVVSLFTIGSLDHLRRGGRLSVISAVVGQILHISPVITTDEDGKLVSAKKYRGRKKAIKAMVDEVVENAKENSLVTIGYTNCIEESNMMKEYLEDKGFSVESGYIDHTMGSHCGPKTLAVFYRKK